MNKKVNKLLWVGDKFMPEMLLKQLGFAYRFMQNRKYKIYLQKRS